jgi:myosin heavy subunit
MTFHSVQSVDVVLAEMFGLQGPESYAYTSQSNCLEVSDIDDIHDYRETIVRKNCWIFNG